MLKQKTSWLILFCLACLLFSLPAISADQKARVSLVRGGVTVSINGATWKLRRNDKIAIGSTLTTSSKGLVQIIFPDKSMIYLKANSSITLEKFHFDQSNQSKDSSVTRLLKGSMRSISGLVGKRNPDKVKFKTSISTIGIRGTALEISEFQVIFDFGQGYTQSNSNPSDRVEVNAGQAATYNRGPRVAFRFSRDNDDPAAWVSRFSKMIPTEATKHASDGSLNMPDLLFTVGLLQQADNFSAGKLQAVIKGFNRNLNPSQRASLTKFSVQVYPQHAINILRASITNKAEIGRVLSTVLRGMSGQSDENIQEVFKAAADLGITPEQAKEVLKELKDQPEAECE